MIALYKFGRTGRVNCYAAHRVDDLQNLIDNLLVEELLVKKALIYISNLRIVADPDPPPPSLLYPKT